MKPIVGFVILTLYVFGLFLLGILITLQSERVCKRDSCKKISKIWRNTLEIESSPCDNFYKSVCGSGNNTETFSEILERSQLSRVISDLKVPNEGYEPTILYVMREAYQGCVDLDRIEKEGMTTVLEVLREPGGFPLLHSHMVSWHKFFDWWCIPFAEYWAYDKGFSTAHFIDISVQKYKRGKRIQFLPYFSIPSSLQLEQNTYNNTKYLNYVFDVVKALNSSKRITEADILQVNKVAEFRGNLVRLAKAITKDGSNKDDTFKNLDVLKTYKSINCNYEVTHKPAKANLKKTVMLKANWRATFDEVVYAPGVDEYLKGLDQLMSNTTIETAANYVAIQHIMQVTPLLPHKLRQAHVKHFGASELESRPLFKDRKLYCAKLVKDQVSTPYSALYIRSHSPEEWENNKVVYEVAERIKQQAGVLISDLKWMDKATKSKMKKKLRDLKFITPLPKDVLKDLANDTLLHDTYIHFCKGGDSILKSYLSLGRAKAFVNIQGLDNERNQTVFNEEHDIVSLNVNFDKERKTVVVPLGVLDFPAFQPDWPQYLNYGGVGAKIALAILGTLNFPGAEHDFGDKTNEGWSTGTNSKYKGKRSCFLQQYNEYIKPKTKRDLSCPECVEALVADRAAAEFTFLSYSGFSKTRFWHESKLPNLLKFTPEQYLFMTFSSFYCSKEKKNYSKNSSDEDIRNPSQEYRVLSSLKNFKDFSNVFDCRKVDKMNPSNKCSIL